MELHYFTFGLGHTFANHVQPILAPNEQIAINKMFNTYGNKWAFHYTEEQWFKSMMQGFGKEQLLELIIAREGSVIN